NWYRQFLNRDADPSGMAAWTDSLRGGNPPEAVLGTILASDEYYRKAGYTPEGFVQSLYRDVVGRYPTREEFSYWLQRTNAEGRQSAATALLAQYPQVWQGPFYSPGAPPAVYRTFSLRPRWRWWRR